MVRLLLAVVVLVGPRADHHVERAEPRVGRRFAPQLAEDLGDDDVLLGLGERPERGAGGDHAGTVYGQLGKL